MDDLQEYPRAHLGRFENDNDDCGCMRACYFVTLKRIGLNSYSECTFEETHWVATETLWFVESTHPSTHPFLEINNLRIAIVLWLRRWMK